jgi:hypothetical protein
MNEPIKVDPEKLKELFFRASYLAGYEYFYPSRKEVLEDLAKLKNKMTEMGI